MLPLEPRSHVRYTQSNNTVEYIFLNGLRIRENYMQNIYPRVGGTTERLVPFDGHRYTV